MNQETGTANRDLNLDKRELSLFSASVLTLSYRILDVMLEVFAFVLFDLVGGVCSCAVRLTGMLSLHSLFRAC